MRCLRIVCLLALGFCLGVPASAGAAFGLAQTDVQFSEEDGSPSALAGAHPFAVTTAFRLNTRVSGGTETPEGSLKDLKVELPLGLAGIPAATPRCTGAQFATLDVNFKPAPIPECPNDSVIGFAIVGAAFNPFPVHGVEEGGAPLYNLVPGPGTVAKFGFVYAKVPVTIELRLSEEAPYRVVASIKNAPQPLLIYGSRVTVWGYPASSAHDPFRGRCLGGVETDGTPVSQGSCPVAEGTPHTAFLTLPRACQGPLTSLFTADSWENPAGEVSLPTETHDGAGLPTGFTGCDQLGFAPQISTDVSNASAESPAGLGFAVEFNGNAGIADPSKRADSDLRKIVARLPEGVTLNPSAADGLVGCTTAQLAAERLGTPPGGGCPEASKIGTVTATSPLVEEPLEGAIFTAEPDDPATATPHLENPFDSFLGIYLVLRNQNLGVIVKQAGKVEADPRSGQLTATFEEAPQLPISRIATHFREGPRAPLATPDGCGSFVAEGLQTSWAGQQVDTTADFHIDSGPGGGPCPSGTGPISPGFSAGTAANAAGSFAPFTVHLTRRDGEAELTRISFDLPEGLTGRLAGIERCPDAAIAAAQAKTGREELATPSCPAGSAIGHVVAGAGVGAALTYVRGIAYLAGPYLGAPFSVVVDTPAVAGPFDLGNVVVREPLRIDPVTAQVSVDGASAPPLPRILRGIPLHLRDLRIDVDRPGFTLNPTSCEPKQIGARIGGAGPATLLTAEAVGALAARFQAASCRALAFRPKVKLQLKGATKRAGHPALKAVVTNPPGSGYANIARAQVGLPHAEFLDQGNIGTVCTQAQLKSDTCPKGSIYGRAKAWTPLLSKPLEGPVYLGVGYGHKLPDLVADLNGEVRILLNGRIDTTKHGGIRNTFEVVPDAPVSRFVLEMKGGKRFGLLENSEDICRKPQRASARFVAQNGRLAQMRPIIANSCKAKHGGKHRRRNAKHRRTKTR